jgi:hypothetical protein
VARALVEAFMRKRGISAAVGAVRWFSPSRSMAGTDGRFIHGWLADVAISDRRFFGIVSSDGGLGT